MKIRLNFDAEEEVLTEPANLYAYVPVNSDSLVVESSNEAYREPQVRIEFSPSESINL